MSVGRYRPPGVVSPSGDGIALLIYRESLVVGGFSRIGRAVLNQEGGFVKGGWFCPAYFLVTFIGVTLSPSWCGIALLIYRESLVIGGFARIGRVVLSVEGENVAKAMVFGWMCAWKLWVVRGRFLPRAPKSVKMLWHFYGFNARAYPSA